MDLLKRFARKKRFWFLLLYIPLLVWSGLYRAGLPEPGVPDTKKVEFLSEISGDQRLPRKIRFTYKEFNTDQSDQTPVIMIHGSPGSAEAFDGLARLITERKIYSVDLPGFGRSEMNISDYSIRAHANYISDFMDRMNIEKAHFAGFSLGGGVILELYEQKPGRVESVSFIASIGVQEYELFGDLYLNRIVHGAQLGLALFLKELTPHFGVFDGMAYTYSRNFFDTDQRPLRKIMSKTTVPFQIIHGTDDPLVPVEAAREHKRIVPQSEYHELDDNHFFVFMRPEKINQLMSDFWTRVDNGKAISRADAEPGRVEESKAPFRAKTLKAMGATAFVLFLILAIVGFINEDLAYLLGAFFAAQGRFGLAFAFIATAFGSVISVLFFIRRARKYLSEPPVNPTEVVFGKNLILHAFGFRPIEYLAAARETSRPWMLTLASVLTSLVRGAVLVGAFYLLSLLVLSIPPFSVLHFAGFLVIALGSVGAVGAYRRLRG